MTKHALDRNDTIDQGLNEPIQESRRKPSGNFRNLGDAVLIEKGPA